MFAIMRQGKSEHVEAWSVCIYMYMYIYIYVYLNWALSLRGLLLKCMFVSSWCAPLLFSKAHVSCVLFWSAECSLRCCVELQWNIVLEVPATFTG